MTRRIAREEGIFAGNSAGSAMAGLLQLKDHFRKDDVVVVIFHDHGSRYLGKMFNDEWMREKGFLEKSGMTARDLVASGLSGELLAIEGTEPVETAVKLMGEHDFSQISITRDKRLVGSLNETHLYERAGARTRGQVAAGRIDHAAGVSVRGHLDAGRSALDDDHAGEPGRAGARLQDRQDLHHHAIRRHPGALIATDHSREHDHLPSMQGLRSIAAVVAGFGFMASTVMVGSIIASALFVPAGLPATAGGGAPAPMPMPVLLSPGQSRAQPARRGDGRVARGPDRRLRAALARPGSGDRDGGARGGFGSPRRRRGAAHVYPLVVGIIGVAGILLGGKLRAAAAAGDAGVIA